MEVGLRPQTGLNCNCVKSLAVWLLDHGWPLDFWNFVSFWLGWHFVVTRSVFHQK